MRPDRPTSTHYTYIAMIDELDGVKQGALRVTGKGVDGCADKSNVLQYKILLVQKSNPKGAGFPTPLILAIVSSSTAVVRVLLWYSTRTNSIAPRRADTVRSKLHTVAASRDGLIRRINMPWSTIVKYLAAVGFSLVLYQVPGTPWWYRTVVLSYCYFSLVLSNPDLHFCTFSALKASGRPRNPHRRSRAGNVSDLKRWVSLDGFSIPLGVWVPCGPQAQHVRQPHLVLLSLSC